MVLNQAQAWAVNCKAHLHLIREASPLFNANTDGGVFLVTSSVAGIAASGSSMAYSVTKAAGSRIFYEWSMLVLMSCT